MVKRRENGEVKRKAWEENLKKKEGAVRRAGLAGREARGSQSGSERGRGSGGEEEWEEVKEEGKEEEEGKV